MPDRLAVRGDECKILGRDTSLSKQGQHSARESLAEGNVQERDILWRASRHGVDDRATLGAGVRLLAKRD